MQKNNSLKWFFLGIIVCFALNMFVFPAFASNSQKQATLVYSNIKISIDGVNVVPKDANNNIVEPFTIDGTTYLPIRAISNALGLDVLWDSNTNTVILSSTPVDSNPEDNIPAQNDNTNKPEPRYAQKGDTAPPPSGTLVWRASKTTNFYHSTSTCSNMSSPYSLSIDDALNLGLDPCSKCWAK